MLLVALGNNIMNIENHICCLTFYSQSWSSTQAFCKELKCMFCIRLSKGNVRVICLVNAICQFGVLKTKAMLVVWCLKAFPCFIYLGVCLCVSVCARVRARSVQLLRLICSLNCMQNFSTGISVLVFPAFFLLP